MGLEKGERKVLGVIPARFGSTRLPGKPLLKVAGRPLLEWVIEAVLKSQKISEVLVATDHPEICDLAESCGVRAIETPSDLASGSDRVWEAVKGEDSESLIVNIQGDEPLMAGSSLDRLVEVFEQEPSLEMATLATELDQKSCDDFHSAKVVLNHRKEAIYFSRHPIPYSRASFSADSVGGALKHIGVYAYSYGFLKRFCEQPPVDLEKLEGLEQLRALYIGARVRVVYVEQDSLGVDTPDDLACVEKKLMDIKKES